MKNSFMTENQRFQIAHNAKNCIVLNDTDDQISHEPIQKDKIDQEDQDLDTYSKMLESINRIDMIKQADSLCEVGQKEKSSKG